MSGIQRCFLAVLFVISAHACGAAGSSSVEQLTVDGVSIRLEMDDAPFRGGAAPLREWVERSARIVSAYYSAFPMSSLRIQVVPESGGGVHGLQRSAFGS